MEQGITLMEEKQNLIVKNTLLVMKVVSDYVNTGDFAVDCTMGNGNDTLSLAMMAGLEGENPAGGLVYAMDVQDTALEKTAALLKDNGISVSEAGGIRLIKDSHENLAQYIAQAGRQPSAIVFNLGFMPGQNKEILTCVDSTLKALKAALECIKEDGIVAVSTYRGHSEGMEEHKILEEYLTGLPSKRYHVAYFNMINQKKTAPAAFFITKKSRNKTAGTQE